MPTDIRGSQVQGTPGYDAEGTVGRDVSRDQGGDQAAWRELVARLELPSSVDPAKAPWPERENLTIAAGPDTQGPAGERAAREEGKPRADRDGSRPGQAASGKRPDEDHPRDLGHVIRPANSQPSSAATGGSATHPDAGQPRDPGPGDLTPEDYLDIPTSPDLGFPGFLDADDQDDPEGRYIPPPGPPLPRLDPVAKGAWTALFGGPGYLLLATMLNWQVPGWAELLAIAAFIVGFVVLVSRLGDGPSRRDGPDQGAVV